MSLYEYYITDCAATRTQINPITDRRNTFRYPQRNRPSKVVTDVYKARKVVIRLFKIYIFQCFILYYFRSFIALFKDVINKRK